MRTKKIGVLALQGSVEEHLHTLSQIEAAEGFPVRTKEELSRAEAIILPGGESTTLRKLLREFDLEDPLRRRITGGMPVWGTCAGMILLAREVEGGESTLSVMDISVRRNAYGRQSDSFSTEAVIPEVSPSDPLRLVFIRAPWVERVWGDAHILCEVGGHIAAVRQHNMLATSFHPELTNSTAFHRYFLSLLP